eukprot:scaffold86165_cov45-Attheya_sp.AAC.1
MLDVSRDRSPFLVPTDDGDKSQQSRTCDELQCAKEMVRRELHFAKEMVRRGLQFAKEMSQLFTDQLNESNPIMTEISNAMTQEGIALAALLESSTFPMSSDDATDHTTTAALSAAKIKMWESHLKDAQDAKAMGHEKLLLCSSKYKNLMTELREQHEADLKRKADIIICTLYGSKT